MGAAISLNSLANIGGKAAKGTSGLDAQPGVKFKEVLDKIKEPVDLGGKVQGKDLFAEIQSMQKNLINAKELSPQDLILYQVKASQFNLRVEMLSKVAEGAVSTFKKFQNPQ